MTPIFEGQPKTRPFPIKTRAIWVLGIFIFICIYSPAAPRTSIFEGQSPKTRPFSSKPRVFFKGSRVIYLWIYILAPTQDAIAANKGLSCFDSRSAKKVIILLVTGILRRGA